MLWEEYQKRIDYSRNTRKDYQKRNLEKMVNKQYNNINSHDIKVINLQGEERQQTINIFAKTSAKTTNTNRNHQRFFISLDPLKAGEKVEWFDDIWIVLTSAKDKEVYHEGFLIKSNAKIKWSYDVWDEDSGAYYQEVAEEYVASYDAGRLEGILNEDEINVPDGQKRVTIPASIHAETIERGKTTFYLDRKTFKVQDQLTIEQEGIKFLVTEEVLSTGTERNPEPTLPPQQDDPITSKQIIGPDFITYGQDYEYEVANSSEPNQWTVAKGEKYVETIEEEGKLYLSVKDMPRLVGKEIQIIATEDGWTDTKTLTIRSVLWEG